MDRRSVGGQRQAKGIIADQSWDRWLEQYWHNKYNPKPEPKKRKVVIDNTFIPYKEAVKTAYNAFNSRGYKYACEVTQSLYSDDKISLIQKSKIVNELCFMQSLTAKQRKIIANKA